MPIHDVILPLVRQFYDRATGCLITDDTCHGISYDKYNYRLKQITTHRLHDTRHTFVSACHDQRLDELTVKRIVGHMPEGVTAKVYTHIELPEMLAEVNKLVL